MYELQYPIGKPQIPEHITFAEISQWLTTLRNFPKRLRELTSQLSNEQLNTPYRDNGWTIRQVIHHLADSHMNSYIRFKWALTENTPIIKAYYEERWAELFDSKTAPISYSLNLLEALHEKWFHLLKGLTQAQYEKEFIHPDGNQRVRLDENIGIYAWHCNHHYAHIKNVLISNQWD